MTSNGSEQQFEWNLSLPPTAQGPSTWTSWCWWTCRSSQFPTSMRWAGQRAGWPRARPGPASPYVAEASARQRLSHSLHHTTGDRLQRSLHVPVEAL